MPSGCVKFRGWMLLHQRCDMPFLGGFYEYLIFHGRWMRIWYTVYEGNLNGDAVLGYSINVNYHEIGVQNIIPHSLK